MVCWIDILMYKKGIRLLKIRNNPFELVWKGQLWLSFGILPKQNITKGVIPCGKVLPYGPLIRGCMAPSVQCSVLVAWKNLLLYVWCTLNWNKLPSEYWILNVIADCHQKSYLCLFLEKGLKFKWYTPVLLSGN